tara:strand:- start:342 stop:548 length:207 start_codon:yes stop_codon:yes gene_type:complete
VIEEKNLKELIKHQIELINLLRLADQKELMETAIARLDQLLDAIPKNSKIPEPLDMCPICLKEEETDE